MANTNHIEKKKGLISFIKELIDQMCDDDLLSDMFCWFEIRKHNQEIQNYHANDQPDGVNDESTDDCLNIEEMLHNLRELDVPAFWWLCKDWNKSKQCMFSHANEW